MVGDVDVLILSLFSSKKPICWVALAVCYAAGVRRGAHQTLQQMTGFGEVNTAQAEYERLADEMWKAQVGARVFVAGAVLQPGCFNHF